jgi:hypothetical protein
MKPDLDLIRELLLRLESLPISAGEIYSFGPEDREIAIDGYSPEDMECHLSLLRDIGFIDCPGPQPMLGITYLGLTWSGRDYLDAVRDPEIWRTAKEGAEAAGGLSNGVLKETRAKQHTGRTSEAGGSPNYGCAAVHQRGGLEGI